jgi:beta propeller repeat protein
MLTLLSKKIATVLLFALMPAFLGACAGGTSQDPPVAKIAVVGDTEIFELQNFLLAKGLQVENFTSPYSLSPAIDGDIVTWTNRTNKLNDIFGYNIATGEEFRVDQDSSRGFKGSPAISGNLIVWQDHRDGSADIYAYDIDAATEFKVNQDTGTTWKSNPKVSGNLIVWQDNRNGDNDIYAYDIATATEFKVNQDAGTADQTIPAVSGNRIVWEDDRNGNADIYAYDLGTATEFKVNQDAGPTHQTRPAISGDLIVWYDYRMERGPFTDIYMVDLATNIETNISHANKISIKTLEAKIGEFDMVLLGDDLDYDYLDFIAAADAAGVPMLGIGTYDNGYPFGVALQEAGMFGLSSLDDYGNSAMHIDVTPDGQGHEIFTGIDTSATIDLENGFGEGDEQAYNIDIADPNAPADWTVLANLGAGMGYSGEATIAEFTTPNGTRIMLDGSANTYNGYYYWTEERWDMLYNQVLYLAGQ